MPNRYAVWVPELWYQMVDIEAENAEEALKLVQAGSGDYIEDKFNYSHTLSDEKWDVEILEG